jgi:hypothetical protein
MKAKEAKEQTAIIFEAMVDNTCIGSIMAEIEKSIADGEYSCKVPVLSKFEVSKLRREGYNIYYQGESPSDTCSYIISWG